MSEFEEWEKQLTAEPEISFAGKVEAFNPKARPGERYTIRVRKDTTAVGEFVSKPPSSTQWGQTNIVGYKWKDGLWLFETAKAAEERKKLSALSPNLQQAGALAKKLQDALLKSKRNNLVAKNSGVKRGQSGIFNLASPYQGNTSMKALNATNTNNGDAVLLLSNSGWVAFGNDTEGGKLTRRDIERSGGEDKKMIRGQVGYVITTLVATIQTNTPNSLSWNRKWQLWVGGLTPNMILVKEWAFSMPSGLAGNPWDQVEEFIEPMVTLDVRGNEWIVSLSRLWFQNDYWIGVYKGTIKDGKPDGTVSPDVTVVWEKKYGEIALQTTPTGTTGFGTIIDKWKPHGFGYFSWIGARNTTSALGYGLKAQQPTPLIQEFSHPTNSPVPLGWESPPDYHEPYNGSDLRYPFLLRVGSNGKSNIITEARNLSVNGFGTSIHFVNEHQTIKVNPNPGASTDTYVINTQPIYDPEEPCEWWHPFTANAGISWDDNLGFFDIYQSFISAIDWLSKPDGLLYKAGRIRLLNREFYPLGVAAGALSNTIHNWQIWDEIFPEMRPADAPMRASNWWNSIAAGVGYQYYSTNEPETPASRAAADEEAMSNIFHSDKDVTVFLRTSNLTGKKDENLTVTTLQAKQILDIVEGGTLRLERLKIHGASFAAEGYQ